MRLGLFGGLFNPPHAGHLRLAEQARRALDIDEVLWIPAGRPPHRYVDLSSPEPAMRFELVRATIAGRDGFRALDLDIVRDDVAYAVDTVRAVAAMHPGAELFFLTGADAFASLGSWKEPDALARLVTFAVYPRGGATTPRSEVGGVRTVYLDAPEVDISSSDIRARFLRCASVRDLVPAAALRLIEKLALYAAPMPDALREHVELVERFAVCLAERWRASVDVLRMAARYHDAYKTLSFGESCAILESRGESVSDIERRVPVLLHGRVAAARLETTVFALQGRDLEEAVDAVRFHTTGRIGMSRSCEILMVADRLGKSWNALDEVPADLRVAIAHVYAQKLHELEQRGAEPDARLKAAAHAHGLAA